MSLSVLSELAIKAVACLIAIHHHRLDWAMTDAHDHNGEPSGSPPPPARPPRPAADSAEPPVGAAPGAARPQPARGAPGGTSRGRPGRGGGRGKGWSGGVQARETGKPTPVRELASAGASPDAEPDIDEVSVDVDGVSWTVRVCGRSGGASPAKAPLLLLGFWRSESTTSSPHREALVVGRLLADYTADELEAALAASREPPEPGRRPGFFSEISDRRR